MLNSTIISTRIQTQFALPLNPFTPSPSSRNTALKSPLISIRKHASLPPKAAATNVFCKLSREETLYDLLGVSPSGTQAEIKRGYKQMVLKYHPDVSPPDMVHEYTARFICVQGAYKTLSDPESRAMYDCSLAKIARSDEMGQLNPLRKEQLEELKRRRTVEMGRVGPDGRMTWAARIRKRPT